MNKTEILDKLHEICFREDATPDQLIELVLDILAEEGRLP